MEELRQILNHQNGDITMALNIYATRIEVSNPIQDNKIDIHLALNMFSEYWGIYGQSISNISYLSNFATIFVDQMLFINEYEEVCVAIKKVMDKEQFTGVQRDWRSA
jgi:hypothetical protein